MAELSPEQIAKGYYTDISGIGTALDKAQEQEALRAKAKQAQQDKLYQGIKDVTSVLDNKFTATGTAADPILLSQINKMKGDLTQGIMSGKISPTAAYMTAGSKVADVNNLAGTISQYRQNVEKKIAELKKDRPELNSELLMNDVIKAGLFDPQTGEIVTPNSNYDYVSTILDQDRTGRYSDKDLIHKISAEEFIKTPGRSFTLNLGNGIESEATVRPGQKVVRGKQGGLDIDYDKLRVGESIQETTVMKNGKPVKKTVNVGLFDAAPDDLINYFEGNRLAKRGALIEMGEMDEYANSNPEYGKKWNSLNDQEKYRVAVLNYAVKHFGTAGSKVDRPSVSAEAQLANMRRSASGGGRRDYVNPVEALIRDYRSGETDPNRLLSHFKDQGVLMGYAQNAYDEEGKPLKIYGKPEIVGTKLMIVPYSSYRALDKSGKPVKDLKFSDGTPITQGRGYDLLNRDKSIAEQEANTMLNVYGRINDDQPDIYTK